MNNCFNLKVKNYLQQQKKSFKIKAFDVAKSFKIKVIFAKKKSGASKNTFKIKQKTRFLSKKGFILKAFKITKQIFI